MRDCQDGTGVTNRLPSLFAIHLAILEFQCIRVQKYLRGNFKRKAVLSAIRSVLPFVPLVALRHSIYTMYPKLPIIPTTFQFGWAGWAIGSRQRTLT